MKVVLLKDVAQVGRQYEIKEVAAGFARHFLLPRRLALLADKTTLIRLEKWREEAEAKRQREEAELNNKLKALTGATVILEAKAAANGHLFAAIHEKDVLTALSRELQIELPRGCLALSEPIKYAGEHIISVKAGKSANQFTLIVRPLK